MFECAPIKYAPRTVVFEKSSYEAKDREGVDSVCHNLNRAVEDIIAVAGLFSDGDPRHAFVTFATPEYRWGVVTWLRSLRRVSNKPVFLLVSRLMTLPADVDGVYMIEIPALYDARSTYERSEFRHVLSKLWIYSLTTLDRVFFVDADCIFLQPVDELFDRSGFLVCPDYVVWRKNETFNSGVMVFTPSEALRQRVFDAIQTVPSNNGGDQTFLNKVILDDVIFIDEIYNFTRHFYYFSNGSAKTDIRIIHYIVKKPWELQYREMPDAMLVDLDDLWTSFLTPEERCELISEWRRSIFHISERQRFENTGNIALGEIEDRVNAIERSGHERAESLQSAITAALDNHGNALRQKMRRKFNTLWIFTGVETAGLLIALYFIFVKAV